MMGAKMGRVLSVALVISLTASVTAPVGASAGGSSAPGGSAPPHFASMSPGAPDARLDKQKDSRAINVRLRPGVPREQLAAAGGRLGFKVVKESQALGWVQLLPNPRVTPGALATRLRESGLVRDVEKAQVYTAADVTPNDPLFAGQWPLENTGQNGGTPDADIDATEVWDTSRGDQGIVVAVIDTGINWSHADLKPNIWRNANEIPGNGVDDDENGYVDDVRGYDFYNYDETVYDVWDGDQHGTHVAGIIAADADNSVGIAGVTDATIMPLKFLGPWGGDDFSGAEAIVYAVDNGARVINCSWGGGGDSEILDEAIAYANEAGVLIVCAAGNDGINNDDARFYPASSPSPNIISVAATDRNDALAEFSNTGVETVDIAAPGVDVNSTLPWETNGLFINRPPYKICYQPVQLEVLEPSSQRDAFIVKSVEQVGASATTPILVVDDSAASVTGETPGERLAVYLDALDGAGYTNITTWETDSQGAPTYAGMRGKVVVWFTGRDAGGWYPDLVIKPAEQEALSTYLDNGGRLVMVSGELATDMVAWSENPEWFYTYFGADLFDFTTWASTVRGSASGRFGGLSAEIPSSYFTDEYMWPTGSDSIVPLDPWDTSVVPLTQVGGYGLLSGTSMAAPHVTGAAALLMAALPSADGDEISSRLCNGSDGLELLEGKVGFGGRLNVASALGSYAGKPRVTAPIDGSKLQAGKTATVSWQPALGGTPTGYEIEFGTPVLNWLQGFEDGTLGGFEKPEFARTGFDVTGDPSWVYEGGFAALSVDPGSAIDLGDGWFEGATSAVVQTITAPPGGGRMSMWWNYQSPSWTNMGDVWLDETPVAFTWGESTDGFQRLEFEVPAGEHRLMVEYVNFEMRTGIAGEGLAIDDLRLTTHDFTPLGAVGAASRELTFTVPSMDTDDAWIRVRATGSERPSSWAYVKGLKISTDGDAPSAPSGLSLTSLGDGWASASWTNPVDADFESTKVLWRTDRFPTGPNDGSAMVAAEGTMTAAQIGPARHGRTAYVAVYAADSAGNWSAAVTGTIGIVDTTPPPAVELLSAETYWGAATVSWMPPDAREYSEITVLRRTDTTPTVGDPAAMTVFEGTGAVASDWMLEPEDERAYYTVYATDETGNRSDVRSVRLDIDLLGPEGTMELAGGAEFTDQTTVEVVSDVSGATQMRLLVGDALPEEVPWQPFETTVTVSFDPLDGPQRVVAEYRDDADNVLQLEDEIYLDLTAPEAPDSPGVENWNTGVRLMMPLSSDPTVIGYRVWRATSAFGPWIDLTTDGGYSPSMGEFLAGSLTAGRTYYFAVSAVDAMGRESERGYPTSVIPGYGVVRVSGNTRYSTAAEIVRRHFTRADTVVLVSGTAWADALGASSLAGCYNAPVLLTGSSALDPFAAAEIERLEASRVIIIGGEKSVAPAVETALSDAGLEVERIAGSDRYDTAGRVAERVAEENGEWDGTVLCVNGTAAADALATGAYAFASKTPIILVRADGVPAGTGRFLGRVAPPGDARWIAVGGPASVPEGVMASFAETWSRIGGADRYAVAWNFAKFAVAQGVLDWGLVGVSSGTATADALAAGPALGKKGGLLLLTTGSALHEVPEAALVQNSVSVELVELYGGTASVSGQVYKDLHDAMGIPTGPIDIAE